MSLGSEGCHRAVMEVNVCLFVFNSSDILQAAYITSMPEVLKYGPNHISVIDKEVTGTGKEFFTYCPKPLIPPPWWPAWVYVG